jgi:hypothetical protein
MPELENMKILTPHESGACSHGQETCGQKYKDDLLPAPLRTTLHNCSMIVGNMDEDNEIRPLTGEKSVNRCQLADTEYTASSLA